MIIKEEMRRTLRFFLWKEKQWKECAIAKVEDTWESGGAREITPEHAEGLKAYGARQASIFRRLHDTCVSQWNHTDSMVEMVKMEVRDPKLLMARLQRERACLLSKPVVSAGLSGATHTVPNAT